MGEYSGSPLSSRLRAAELLPLVPAAAIPLLFLHRSYQAHVSVGPVDVYSSDAAAAAVVAAALAAGILWGWAPLRRPLPLWIAAGALLGLLVASVFWTPLELTTKHLVTAAKIVEYALLAPSVVLLMRRAIDVDRFLAIFVAWSVAAAVWGVLQFLGLVNEFFGKRPGQREVSFLGIHDFAGFAGAALAIGFAGLVLGRRRRLTWVALAAGTVGSILPASVFAYSGIVLAAILATVIGRRAGTLRMRHVLALVGILAVVGAGAFALRVSDVTNFLSFLGKPTTSAPTDQIQTGSQRVMLAYIGLRIWRDHPILGVGFERSTTGYGPYLADAKRRYPDEAPTSFPSKQNAWGVQNYWLQTLADLGVVGLVLALATFGTGLVLALRAPAAVGFVALVAASWILVAAATWNALGIVAGNPLQALTWLGLGTRRRGRRAHRVSEWPGADKRKPRKSYYNWSLRAPLARWLEEEGRAAAGLRVLDVGCGEKPYLPYFDGASEYVGVDVDESARADVVGAAERLPLPDASFDLVLCLQVLEHVDDPARAVRELHRVVKPGGRVLVATHGAYVFHPSPVDYWRWTHTGLARLLEDNGEWRSVEVAAGSGTASSLGLLVGVYVDQVAQRLHAVWLGQAVNWTINSVAGWLDRRAASLRDPRPGSLTVNFHVVAER